uniref:Uncharacterized protein n=1 Tax=Rhizophora mucronata TaxID=61149 RepID=A0A2P2M792_RHIMU
MAERWMSRVLFRKEGTSVYMESYIGSLFIVFPKGFLGHLILTLPYLPLDFGSGPFHHLNLFVEISFEIKLFTIHIKLG